MAPMRKSARSPNALYIALAALVLSLTVNFGGVSYYVNEDRKLVQAIQELQQAVEKSRVIIPPPAPVKSTDELKYLAATFRAIQELQQEVAALKASHQDFRKLVEPRLEKLDGRRR
jgi:HAMP domain-containing protein